MSASIVVMTAILVLGFLILPTTNLAFADLSIITSQIAQTCVLPNTCSDVNDPNRSTEVKPTLFWKIKIFFEDVQEAVTFDNNRKKLLITQHALERQIEINECLDKFDSCPREFEIRRLQKIEQAESITGGGNVLLESIDEIKRLGEYNEIRIAVSEFHQARDTTDPVQRELLLDSINDRVNKLKTVKSGCTGTIDSRQIIQSDNFYEEVQKTCPKLRTMPIATVYEKLYADPIYRGDD